MTKHEEARLQLQWHLDNGRGPFDLVFAALEAGEAAEAKLAEVERERDEARSRAMQNVTACDVLRARMADIEARETSLREAMKWARDPHRRSCAVHEGDPRYYEPVYRSGKSCNCGLIAALAVGTEKAMNHADVLNPKKISDEEVDRILREEGFDPEQVARNGRLMGRWIVLINEARASAAAAEAREKALQHELAELKAKR